MKRNIFSLIILFSVFLLPAEVFNKKLTQEERDYLESGNVLIKNINYDKNICINEHINEYTDEMLEVFDELHPKYLAEIIQFKPIDGNEDLPQKLESILTNVTEYSGIPYYSVRAEEWYNLYDSAIITKNEVVNDTKIICADLEMSPFGTVNEYIEFKTKQNLVYYMATNKNLLRYYDKFDCVGPDRMKIVIVLFQDGDNWILYGIGGVNAPRIPFFTERIQTSFINRINTFCSFIFEKF